MPQISKFPSNNSGTRICFSYRLVIYHFRFHNASSAQTRRGCFKEKITSRTKNLPIECAQGDGAARCPNHFFAVNEPFCIPWWWCDLVWCHEVACGLRWSNVLGCEVTWGELLWLVATSCVMLCHLVCLSRHLVRCAWSCHVTWCTTNCYSSTAPNLLQHYSVLQSTTPGLLWLPSSIPVCFSTPVLLCTTKDYYYSVLTSATLVLVCTTLVLLWLPSPAPEVLRATKNYSVLQKTTPALLRTTKCYSVLEKTTPALLCTTKDYSSTTRYYKLLLRHCKILTLTANSAPVLLRTTKYFSNTTPVLFGTTKYYSNPTPCYKILVQYYSVLQRSTPVLLQYYKSTTPVLQITTPVLLSNIIYNASEQQASPSHFKKYCTCQPKWISSVIRVPYKTLLPMRRAARITLQLHQILCLPSKINIIIDPVHI